MTGAGETEGTYVELPKPLKELAKDDDRTLKELMTEGLESELGVTAEDSIAVLRRKKRRKETRKRELEEQRDEIDTQIERYEKDIARIDEAIEAQEAQRQSYEAMLDNVLGKMENGDIQHFIPDLSEARELRQTHERDFEEILHDLKQRGARQNRAIYNTQFMQKQEADRYVRQSERGERLISECVDPNESDANPEVDDG